MHHLLFSLVILASLSICFVLGDNLTCVNSNLTWYYNTIGETPCLLFQKVLNTCQPGFSMYELAAPPVVNICASPCCCNTVSYALLYACYVCQYGAPDPKPPTYAQYLGGSLEDGCPNGGFNIGVLQQAYQAQLNPDEIPEWAFIPVLLNETWSYAAAVNNASTKLKATLPISTTPITSSTTSNSLQSISSANSDTMALFSTPATPLPLKDVKSNSSTSNAGLIAGVVVGVAAVIGLACVVVYYRKYRSQPSQPRRVTPSVIFNVAKSKRASIIQEQPSMASMAHTAKVLEWQRQAAAAGSPGARY